MVKYRPRYCSVDTSRPRSEPDFPVMTSLSVNKWYVFRSVSDDCLAVGEEPLEDFRVPDWDRTHDLRNAVFIVAQWLQNPTDVTEVVDLIPTWNSEIFTVVP